MSNLYADVPGEERTPEQGYERSAHAYKYALAANANRSPRELAEQIARGATENRTVDQIEDDVRARRGLPPLHSIKSA